MDHLCVQSELKAAAKQTLFCLYIFILYLLTLTTIFIALHACIFQYLYYFRVNMAILNCSWKIALMWAVCVK